MSNKIANILYAFCAVVESFGGILQLPESVHYITKPALMIILIWYFLNECKGKVVKNKTLFVLAMIGALLGDTFLMFQQQNPFFFVLGLGSFLLMQIGYSIYFNREIEFSKSLLKHKPYFIIPVIIYSASLYLLLADKVGDLKPAILAYTLCISVMMLAAINRFGQVSQKSFNWVFWGALLFLISDSCIAINKFGSPIPMAGFCIMATYAAAQYLIVGGVDSHLFQISKLSI